jgi:hypothetical protein
VVEQLAQGDLTAVGELGHPAAQAIIEIEQVALGELEHQRGDERLGDTARGEQGAIGHPSMGTDAGFSAAARPNPFAGHHNRG